MNVGSHLPTEIKGSVSPLAPPSHCVQKSEWQYLKSHLSSQRRGGKRFSRVLISKQGQWGLSITSKVIVMNSAWRKPAPWVAFCLIFEKVINKRWLHCTGRIRAPHRRAKIRVLVRGCVGSELCQKAKNWRQMKTLQTHYTWWDALEKGRKNKNKTFFHRVFKMYM